MYCAQAKLIDQERQEQADEAREALPWWRQQTVGQTITAGLRDRAARRQLARRRARVLDPGMPGAGGYHRLPGPQGPG